MFFLQIFSLILAVCTLLFGAICFQHQKKDFFIIGLIVAILTLILSLFQFQGILHNLNILFYPTILAISAWCIGVVFLILSKANNNSRLEDNDYLNEIINSDDEDWDIDID